MRLLVSRLGWIPSRSDVANMSVQFGNSFKIRERQTDLQNSRFVSEEEGD